MEFHAFLSYSHVDDDEFSGDVIEQLRRVIESEARKLTGRREFRVFRNLKDIGAGEDIWNRIDNALEQSFVLIPLITPAYFESDACLHELERFLEKENELGR